MAKTWYRKKPSRASKAYTKNWRHRSPTKTAFDPTLFSEDSIQRQLAYLVPRLHEGYDERYSEDFAFEDAHAKPEECCWHACGSLEWIWCCGHTCWMTGGEERAEGDEGVVEDVPDSGEGKSVESRSCEGVEDSLGVVTDGDLGEEKGAKVDASAFRWWRDAWPCDFCGVECFCDVAVAAC
ncbi:hypothetical protein CC86DRAFT_404591 [Ophiobolus disseminans]|uniref:Uncharacterized protein n=1 Tax=Ophiobolus disseminans TaxID=1469910 RepID=A0A6A7A7B5_9PLEO|nr:hypothetical protein CC86DRAFT_404591 [Ophiobolus disseminans]